MSLHFSPKCPRRCLKLPNKINVAARKDPSKQAKLKHTLETALVEVPEHCTDIEEN